MASLYFLHQLAIARSNERDTALSPYASFSSFPINIIDSSFILFLEVHGRYYSMADLCEGLFSFAAFARVAFAVCATAAAIVLCSIAHLRSLMVPAII